MNIQTKRGGFTIVELLIVIVVIAILAAISVVAYTGIQDRARYTEALSNLTSIDKAIGMYHAQHGNYPIVTSWQYYCSDPGAFVADLNDIIQTIPAAPCTGPNNSDDTWLYRSDATGTEYKLLYIRANVSSGFRNLIPADMRDTASGRWGAATTWGYWTDGYAAT